ncbi:MAG: IS66 family transposase [Marinagarivorans sp.]|nr:IS66 family transposase [Marinagarivorans sp.]
MINHPELLAEIVLLKERNLQLEQELAFYREQFKLAQAKRFGASSEKSPQQLDLLMNEAEVIDDHTVATESVEIPEKIETQKSEKPRGRKPLPKELPRETRIVDIDDADKVCTCCSGELHKFGEETSEQLKYIPAKMTVIVTVRPKYSCRQCEKNNTHTPIVIAPVPASPIPKSIATPSLLSQVICNKYQFAIPLYRQEALFKQIDIELNRKTLANWMIRSATVFEPVIKALKDTLLVQGAIHADETPVKVIQEDREKCYMWVYCSGADSPGDTQANKNIVLYDYQPSRAASCPNNYLGGYKGFLQVDGYVGYESTKATLVGCMAHARRKFVDAQKAQLKGKSGRADWAVSHIQKLYRIESQLKTKTNTERFEIRQNLSVPLLNEFKQWLDKTVSHVVPNSAIGKAVNYTLNQWSKLIAYTQDGQLSIDNNRAERAIKPFVIGRKNWLFSATTSGANASANLYSIIESAKVNGLEPRHYIEYLLTELPKRKVGEDVKDLLPWMVKLGVVS